MVNLKTNIMRYKRIGYNVDVMRQSDDWRLTQSLLTTLLPSLIEAGGSGFRLYDSPKIKLSFNLVWSGHLSASWPIGVQLVVFFCSSVLKWYC